MVVDRLCTQVGELAAIRAAGETVQDTGVNLNFKPSIWHVARVTVAEVRTQDQSRAHRLGQRRGGVVYLGVGVNMLPRYPACGCGCISSISGQHI